MNPLYTIGHSTHDWEHFVQLLQLHKIEVLGDVRSMPYSRFTPQYNRESLTGGLEFVRGLNNYESFQMVYR